MRSPALILTCLQLAVVLRAQQNEVPLNRDIYSNLERNAARLDNKVHSGLKPVMERRADLTGVMGYAVDSTKYYYWITEKLFRDHLFIVKEGDVRVTLDPLFEFQYGYDPGDRTVYSDTNQYGCNTRGFWIRGDLGPKVSFETMFHESQTIVPQYLYLYARRTGVIPGQGRVKFEEVRELDIGWSQAKVSYSPIPWFNIQFGHGKHFIGHGYRSMLLSDNALNAPFLQFSAATNDRRFQYTTWHTRLMHGVRPTQADRLPTGDASESLFYWYRARFNHLSVDLGRVQLGLFEASQFETIDENGVKPFDPMELNPVMGINTLLYGFDSEGTNALIGADLRLKVLNKAYVYGQFAYDGRTAYQAGARAFDVLLKDLNVQLEWNSADRFMYQHTPARIAYMHASQPLAHPLGNAFSEVVSIVEGGYKRYRLQVKVNVASLQRDLDGNSGGGTNLFQPDEGLPEPITELTDLMLTSLDLNASMLVNPNTNLRFVCGFVRRDLPDMPDNEQSGYVYIALRTALFNRYYDI